MLVVQYLAQLPLRDHEHGGRRDCRGASDAYDLADQARFAEKVPGAEHCHHGFFAGSREHRQLDAAALDVHHRVAGLALREDGFGSRVLEYPL
jgi:hypothetical protein